MSNNETVPIEVSFSGLNDVVFSHIIHNRRELFENFFYEHRLIRFERIDWSYDVHRKTLVMRLFEEIPGELTMVEQPAVNQ